MEQYIPKAAVVAEIKELDNFWHLFKDSTGQAIVEDLLSFINTLEVKEVYLEKEVRNYIKNNFTSVEEPDEVLTTLMQLDDMVSFAKHFFELGIKAAQKGKDV